MDGNKPGVPPFDPGEICERFNLGQPRPLLGENPESLGLRRLDRHIDRDKTAGLKSGVWRMETSQGPCVIIDHGSVRREPDRNIVEIITEEQTRRIDQHWPVPERFQTTTRDYLAFVGDRDVLAERTDLRRVSVQELVHTSMPSFRNRLQIVRFLDQLGTAMADFHAPTWSTNSVPEKSEPMKPRWEGLLAITDHAPNQLGLRTRLNHLHDFYERAVTTIITPPYVRVHGDLHTGNLGWTRSENKLVFNDLDRSHIASPYLDILYIAGQLEPDFAAVGFTNLDTVRYIADSYQRQLSKLGIDTRSVERAVPLAAATGLAGSLLRLSVHPNDRYALDDVVPKSNIVKHPAAVSNPRLLQTILLLQINFRMTKTPE
jgi:hypothetical protein